MIPRLIDTNHTSNHRFNPIPAEALNALGKQERR
jgi:hypothetical protein